ncbi:coiled-coil domain-containing protein 62 isoform X2 [Xiphias gladius]|uniref:coiled-coil domain-containing protein 62 isoform X2 n=1 Tax=Xiphias gladius TaxID=8245 RepID=UPI001A9A156F|nr:coiled-coil domain-containing protein 62 isoform X2 [Xiphias gladius]
MDEGRRRPPSDEGACGKASACFPFSNDTSAEPWHSTPVKKKNGGAPLDVSQNSPLTSFKMDSTAKQWAKRTPPIPADTPCPHSSLDTEFPVNDLSGSTIQRQRRELQLLMAELKDRDRELNTMAASHHKQLQAWEQDRQRVLTLEQRCTRLDDELQKRNEVIRVLTKRVWVVETREREVQKELGSAQQLLRQLEQKQQNISQKCHDFEDKNQSLNSTLMALSTQVGSLQVREEELSSMLKLKEKDVTEASSHILDLTGRLRDLDTSLTESRSRETKVLRDLEENKRRYREARHEVTHLKEELQQQITQGSSQREEMIRLKQELQLLRRDLALSGEGDSWKDELLEMARSKQERTMSELRCLRQVCENQRNDLQLLQLNLERARGTLREKTSQGLHGSQEELTCDCLDKRSPSSIRVKNAGLVRDTTTLPGAGLQQGSVNDGLGVFSPQSADGDDPLSSFLLRQLVDESRRSSPRPRNSLHDSGPALSYGTTEPLYSHECQTAHRHHHPTSPAHEASGTPPRACPRHGTGQPRGWLDAD